MAASPRRIAFYSPLDPGFVGGVRTWLAEFWGAYLQRTNSRLVVVHAGHRPAAGAFEAWNPPESIELRPLSGRRMPMTGARLPNVRDVSAAFAGVDVVYLDNGYFLQDRIVVAAARERNIPVISGHHSVIGGSFLNRMAWNASGRHLIPQYAAVHALNHADARYLESLSARNVCTIPMPLQTEKYRCLERAPEPFVVSFLGRLHPQKGVDRWIAVAKRLKQRYGAAIRLRVGGDGPMRREIEMLASVGVVEYVGYVQRADVPAYLGGTHVLVMPSLYETFGIVAAEAQACGAMVVASNIPALRDVVISGGGALVANPDDASAWIDAIDSVRLNAMDAAISWRLADEAKRRYGFDAVASAFDRLLSVATDGTRTRS